MAYTPTNPNGQTTMANSQPVVLPSDQSIIIAGYDSDTNKLITGNVAERFKDGFSTLDQSKWTYVVDGNDLMFFDGNVAAASYMTLCKSAITGGSESYILSNQSFQCPIDLYYGMNLSQRINQQEFCIDLVGVSGNSGSIIQMNQPPDINIAAPISVNANVWTIPTCGAHGLIPGMTVSIYGCTESRLNIGPTIVTTTPTSATFTVGATLATSSFPTGLNGYIEVVDPADEAQYLLGVRYVGTTAGNADAVSMNGGNFPQVINWNPGNSQDSPAIPNENGLNYAGLAYTRSFRSKGEWQLAFNTECADFVARDQDANSAIRSVSVRRQNIPDQTLKYKIRWRAKSFKNLSRPVAPIISISKTTGSSTCNITANNHGLTPFDWVTIYGVRDTTNFANVTAQVQVPVVIDANTIQVPVGNTTFTGASAGGYVFKVNGGNLGTPQTIVVQSFAQTLDKKRLLLIGSGTWTETIGNIVTVYGIVETVGNISHPELTGRYRVALISTTTMELEPMEPALVTAVQGLSNVATLAGGAIIKNTDFRAHYCKLFELKRNFIDVRSNHGDLTRSLPVQITGITPTNISMNAAQWGSQNVVNGGLNGTVAIGGAAADSAATTTNPATVGGKVKTATDATYAAGDAQFLTCTTDMQLVTKPYSIPELDFQTTTTFTASSASTALKGAGGANVRNNVTGLKISNASNENIVAIVLDGTIPLYQQYIPALTDPPMTTFQTPLRGTANAALNIAISGQANHPGWTNGGLVFVSTQGYQAF